ncbi:MAG: hypothetical protein Q4G27_10295 [Flavobacteriaceae bacterium]|nr:hypothetical protein [Flavobacteriaceae bacterium]
MKFKLSIWTTLLLVVTLSAQVAIEKDYTGNPSVLLEFNDTRDAAKTATDGVTEAIAGKNKTLILPIVETINANEDGTIWFDAADNIIKYKSPAGTVNMTEAGSDVVSPAFAEIATPQGTIIGEETSTANGVLVLEANDKAMVLPVVDGIASVINPEPGSMVYDKQEKAIAIFNGDVWYFWGNY